MPQNDPRRSGQSYSLTIRPFAGRNSDIDQASIETNQASGGSNFYIQNGVIRRRKSFSRIMPTFSLPGGITNTIHAILPLFASSNTNIDGAAIMIGRGGMFRICSPDKRVLSQVNSYSAGSVSLNTGSRTMAGTNTAWVARGIHPGASITQGSQSLRVRSITSNTSIELVAAPTTGGSSLAYSIPRYGHGENFVNAEGTYPVPAEIAVRRAGSVGGGSGTTIGSTVGTFAAGAHITTVTQGSRNVVVSSTLAAAITNSFLQNWMRFPNDVGQGLDGYNPDIWKRGYKIIRVDGTTIVLNERYRGTVGAGSGGVYINQGYTFVMSTDSANTDNWWRCRWDIGAAGTISITAGDTAVRGTGTAFQTISLLPGDEIQVSGYRTYRVASVTSNTSCTISHPLDATTVSGDGPVYRQWRRVMVLVNGSNSTLQTGTLSSRVGTGSGTGYFFPNFWGLGQTPNLRMMAVFGMVPHPDTTQTNLSHSVFICTREVNDNVLHNIFWAYENPNFNTFLTREMVPLSGIAPRARHIEYWNGRLFAADLREPFSNISVDRRLRVRWTRVNEPYSWWNQYPTDGSGFDDISGGSGSIRAMKVLPTGNGLCIYREWGFTVLYATGDSINPFRKDYFDYGPGPADIHTIVSYKGSHVWLAVDGTIQSFDGNRVTQIPCPLERFIKDNVNFQQIHWSMAVHNECDSELSWFIPTTASSTNLTAAIVYNYKYQEWYVQDFTSRPLVSVAYLPRMDNTQENRILGFDANFNVVAFRTSPGFDFITSIGAGTLFTTQWISKEMVLPIPDLTSEDREKEVNAVEVAYDPTYSGRLQMEVSGDGGINWTNFGTNTLTYGSTAGTSLSRGNGMTVGRTHMVRLTQTPANTTTDTSMSLRWVRIIYADYGAVPS